MIACKPLLRKLPSWLLCSVLGEQSELPNPYKAFVALLRVPQWSTSARIPCILCPLLAIVFLQPHVDMQCKKRRFWRMHRPAYSLENLDQSFRRCLFCDVVEAIWPSLLRKWRSEWRFRRFQSTMQWCLCRIRPILWSCKYGRCRTGSLNHLFSSDLTASVFWQTILD